MTVIKSNFSRIWLFYSYIYFFPNTLSFSGMSIQIYAIPSRDTASLYLNLVIIFKDVFFTLFNNCWLCRYFLDSSAIFTLTHTHAHTHTHKNLLFLYVASPLQIYKYALLFSVILTMSHAWWSWVMIRNYNFSSLNV